MIKKRVGQIVDILMYSLLLIQMLYVFTGNNVHEVLGVCFFICLIAHIIIKKWWFSALFKKKPGSFRLFDAVTCLLMLSIIILMLSSMGVSRFLFPQFVFLGSSDLHRYMATAVLTLGVLHGCLIGIRRSKRKKLAVTLTVLACIASLSIGLFAVSYLNRHLRAVDISSAEKFAGEMIDWNGKKPLVVYFTRIGNTDFDPDVDAVSGASLMIVDGELTGSDQFLAEMIADIIDCETVPITLTEYRYPSSYNDTIGVAGDELRAQARPAIQPIDISDYDSIILIYPLWWNSIPMPVASFLEQNDFNGKTIYLIATQGSSGYGNTVSEIEALAKGATVIPETSIYCEDIPDSEEEILQILKRIQ
ncbi:MAG: hypothetical protein K6G67_01390 [Lachnospiraceae bacterium]|nr:hypothetical protein [Lachnospiraceae bacterium]